MTKSQWSELPPTPLQRKRLEAWGLWRDNLTRGDARRLLYRHSLTVQIDKYIDGAGGVPNRRLRGLP